MQRDLTVGLKEWGSDRREAKINYRSEKELNTSERKHGKIYEKNCNWKRKYNKQNQAQKT